MAINLHTRLFPMAIYLSAANNSCFECSFTELAEAR
jgi:hypothetical protein